MKPPSNHARRGVTTRCRRGAGWLLVLAGLALVAPDGSAGQEPQRVRVPSSHANVHQGPSSGRVVLWLAPRGTVLEVVDRRGEWLAVRLTPEMRRSGMVMRWYENEEVGWMHETTVERVHDGQPSGA